MDRWDSRAIIISSVAGVVFDVSLPLAGLCGLVWGIVAWTATEYPEEFSVSFHGLYGRDRWLAGMSLLLIGCAFATVRVIPVEGGTALVLYAEILGVSIGLSPLSALVEEHNSASVEIISD